MRPRPTAHARAAIAHARVPGERSDTRDKDSAPDLARRRHLPDRRRGPAGPTEADETAVGVVEIVEPVEEIHTGIHERRPYAADQIERGRRQRIAARSDREAVERLRRRFGRNRDRALAGADQSLRTA